MKKSDKITFTFSEGGSLENMTGTTINIRYLAGRCANGAERDGGTLFHAVPAESWKALCGSEPGRRSAGWGTPWRDEQPVTCPRCLKRMKQVN